MTPDIRAELESIGDRLEQIHMKLRYIGSDYTTRPNGQDATSLMSIAWDIKQLARYNTASFGV